MNLTIEAVELTRTLLSFNTVNPPGQELQCARYLGTLLEQGGFTIEYFDLEEGRPNLIARMGRGANLPLCFSGHMDTVPLGTAQWSKDPFSGEIEGDKMYGRGSTDMKGGIAAMVTACLRLAELSGGTVDLMIILTASEETGCRGAEYLANLETSLGTVGALIVGEPTSNYPLVGHKGALFLEGRTTGITAHGSMPDKGVNAIYKAARAVSQLEHFDFGYPPHPLFGLPTLNVGTMSGGETINVVPDNAVIGIDIRTVPGQDNQSIYEKLRGELGRDVKLTCLTNASAVATNPEDQWVQQVFDVMESYLNERPSPRVATYFTDASSLTPALGNPPTILLGPGEPHMAHKTDEFCYIYRIEQAAEAYVKIGRKWGGL
jgi:succinyl-diaminopimelate desuccinylase